MASAAAVMRKTVTVLFCDVAGSTELGERLDPEALRAVMTRWFDAMRTPVERAGGTVEKFVGDAVMAVFGVPAAHEDDAFRAVQAAVEMRDAAVPLGLGIRIGVNTGEVVTGDGATTLVTGDAVNTAKRLEEAAAPGEILIGAPTRRLVANATVLEPAGAVSAKGKRERSRHGAWCRRSRARLRMPAASTSRSSAVPTSLRCSSPRSTRRCATARAVSSRFAHPPA